MQLRSVSLGTATTVGYVLEICIVIEKFSREMMHLHMRRPIQNVI